MAGCGPVDLSSNEPFSCKKSVLGKERITRRFSESLSPRSELFLSKRKSSQKETVLRLLKQKALTQKQLAKQLGVTTRAVRYALSELLKRGIILQRASLLDARQKYYEVIK